MKSIKTYKPDVNHIISMLQKEYYAIEINKKNIEDRECIKLLNEMQERILKGIIVIEDEHTEGHNYSIKITEEKKENIKSRIHSIKHNKTKWRR